jgi:WD domain, G-beta repeat
MSRSFSMLYFLVTVGLVAVGFVHAKPVREDSERVQLRTGTERATLMGHRNEVKAVAFSPDGKTLASGSVDDAIRNGPPSRDIHRR